MLIRTTFELKRDEIEFLRKNKKPEYIQKIVQRKIADELTEKLIPFMPIKEEHKPYGDVQFSGKMILIGNEDFFRIRGLLGRLQGFSFKVPSEVVIEVAKEIDDILYSKFNNIPGDIVLPGS